MRFDDLINILLMTDWYISNELIKHLEERITAVLLLFKKYCIMNCYFVSLQIAQKIQHKLKLEIHPLSATCFYF